MCNYQRVNHVRTEEAFINVVLSNIRPIFPSSDSSFCLYSIEQIPFVFLDKQSNLVHVVSIDKNLFSR